MFARCVLRDHGAGVGLGQRVEPAQTDHAALSWVRGSVGPDSSQPTVGKDISLHTGGNIKVSVLRWKLTESDKDVEILVLRHQTRGPSS
jgi:hypothetical protein